IGLVVAIRALLSPLSETLFLTWQVPAGHFVLTLDSLSAFFLLPIFLLTTLCALYGIGYLNGGEPLRKTAMSWVFFNLLSASMVLVVTAANALLFLMSWEIMSLSSFFLVAFDHENAQVRRASWLYLLSTHLGVVFLFALFLLATTWSGGSDFSSFASLADLGARDAALLFIFALIGFGSKAGLFPLHVWLPDAHAAAPSHVSALMSGVMIKTGIYGILRIVTFLPPAPAWWGWLIAGLGIIGALYGIALAALQRDIKRCLAYSTIENVGIILLGLGFGMVAQAQGHPSIALLAYAGGLLHIWNHALFKGLMFFGAGSLLHATGTRDMNRMGGLLKRMPLAGLLWIGGSLAISALPPLNGLISEWLIYLSLLQAGSLGEVTALPALLLIGLLSLVGALALVTFSRLIGIALLGEPRDRCAEQAHEASPLMLLPMALLLTVCLAIGLFPGETVRLLSTPLALLLRQPETVLLPAPLTGFGLSAGVLLLSLLFGFLLLRLLRRARTGTESSTWGCGFRFPTSRMSYTGEAYSEITFRQVLPKALHPTVTGGVVTGLFPEKVCLQQISLDPVLTRQWLPLFVSIADRCQRLRWLQQGQLPFYLIYIFIISAVLMVWSLWAGGEGG
ncbi:MAG: oxidoreductase, partial [Desulfuromonadales bacterium]|nr:oxidoreductase [Desulfuromonadales bacterium]